MPAGLVRTERGGNDAVGRGCGLGLESETGCRLHLSGGAQHTHPRAISVREIPGYFPEFENRCRLVGTAGTESGERRRLRESGADEIVTSLAEALERLKPQAAEDIPVPSEELLTGTSGLP